MPGLQNNKASGYYLGAQGVIVGTSVVIAATIAMQSMLSGGGGTFFENSL